MNIELRPTSDADAAAVSEFLTRILEPPARSSYAADAHLAWKYWLARPDWPGSRSFTARHNGTILAHAAAWPVRLLVPGAVVPAVHVVDWVADPAYPGAGIWLMRRIARTARAAIATGGSDMTRRILPVIGFRPHGHLWCFARPVRPLAQVRTAPKRGWRTAARLARNTAWRISEPLSCPRGWSARHATPEDIPDRLWPRPSSTTAVTARDRAFYEYILRAPSPRHELFVMNKDEKAVGYFCVAFAPRVARIADLWLDSTSVNDWRKAVRTAAAAAAASPEVCEVTVWASTSLAKAALSDAGFRVRDQTEISVSGDVGFLEGRALHLQMLDCDASVIARDVVSYLT